MAIMAKVRDRGMVVEVAELPCQLIPDLPTETVRGSIDDIMSLEVMQSM